MIFSDTKNSTDSKVISFHSKSDNFVFMMMYRQSLTLEKNENYALASKSNLRYAFSPVTSHFTFAVVENGISRVRLMAVCGLGIIP